MRDVGTRVRILRDERVGRHVIDVDPRCPSPLEPRKFDSDDRRGVRGAEEALAVRPGCTSTIPETDPRAIAWEEVVRRVRLLDRPDDRPYLWLGVCHACVTPLNRRGL